jgi:hypothetical protein
MGQGGQRACSCRKQVTVSLLRSNGEDQQVNGLLFFLSIGGGLHLQDTLHS